MNNCTNPNSSPIELFAFPTSPYSWKVACYLAFLGQDYEFIGVSPITFKEVKFTGKRQVPVLRIGEEWKLESADIGEWLENQLPGHSLFGSSTAEKEQIKELDNWISHQMITATFRLVVDWPSTVIGLRNGWKLAAAVNQTSPLPKWVQIMWPLFLRKAKFIVAMMETLDRSEKLPVCQARLVEGFVSRLEGGPFLGGREQPSLADLSAFPIVVLPYRFGLEGDANWAQNDRVLNWVNAVQQFLPENPFLLEEDQLIRPWPSKMPVL